MALLRRGKAPPEGMEMHDQDEEATRPGGAALERGERRAGAFYGRRKAKPLRRPQAQAYERLLPALRLPSGEPFPQQLGALFAHGPRDVFLEIGFGGGEHLGAHALRRPDCGFIGAEPFVNGVASLLRLAAEQSIGNIRVHDEDATALLDRLPAASIAGIDLFYPDPWPKKRHWKRRFVSNANLDRIARVLRPGAALRFASDWPHYVEWTLELARAHPAFDAPSPGSDLSQPFEGWVRTRYEAKAIREGRVPAYVTFTRRDDTQA
jgi:tRNA (guanine-N7-)-methyltransferase